MAAEYASRSRRLSKLAHSAPLSVCICTLNREDFLERTLRSLALQELPAGSDLEIIVVDNDAAGSARGVVQDFAKAHARIRVDYSIQPEKNISLARNQSVARATGEYLFFIDDDEIAQPGWMQTMYVALLEFDVDAISSDVRAMYDTGTPDWVKASGFFDRRAPKAGQAFRISRQGNCLIRRRALTPYMLGGSGPFAPEFGRSGGEDALLFRTMMRDGFKLTGCPDAIVHEWVPAERGNLSWMLRRAKRMGSTFVQVELIVVQDSSPQVWLQLLVKAVAQAARFGAIVVLSGGGVRLRARLRLAAYVGHLLALFGRPYKGG